MKSEINVVKKKAIATVRLYVREQEHVSKYAFKTVQRMRV